MVTVITDAFSKEGMLNMVFTTAIEGGINYWADVIDYTWSDHTEDCNMIVEFFGAIVDREDGKNTQYGIDVTVIKRGIRRAFNNRNLIGDEYQRDAIAELYYGVVMNSQVSRDDVDFDATTADIIVQYGLFGELVYG